jgi:uncharacterized protein YciI
MAEDTFYLAVSQYVVSEEGVFDSLVEHRAWTKSAYDAGTLLFTGRQDPPTGGVLGFRAPSRAAAEAFVASDPFSINKVATYTLIAVTPTHAPWRSPLFDAFMDGA